MQRWQGLQQRRRALQTRQHSADCSLLWPLDRRWQREWQNSGPLPCSHLTETAAAVTAAVAAVGEGEQEEGEGSCTSGPTFPLTRTSCRGWRRRWSWQGTHTLPCASAASALAATTDPLRTWCAFCLPGLQACLPLSLQQPQQQQLPMHQEGLVQLAQRWVLPSLPHGSSLPLLPSLLQGWRGICWAS